jgi:hypothetical protein
VGANQNPIAQADVTGKAAGDAALWIGAHAQQAAIAAGMV